MKKLIMLLTLLIPISFTALGHVNASQLLEAKANRITEKEAGEIALKKVKGEIISVKLEVDDGKEQYEVKIKHAGAFYEVEIDAKTGQVLEVEKEGSHRGDDDRHGDDDGHDDDDRHGEDDGHHGDDDHLDD
ncbi:PepSY domain-containing protein [Neobacillus sp. NPDC058068]|uniref:PepSY domain-containing protein n=1 Tax=Neobacillus sp. NPDC058068 TaxID=3346325 RepID=UPI0036D85055